MTEVYFPFDAGAGAGVPTEDSWEQLHDPLGLDGVVAGYPGVTPITTERQVYGDSSGRQVKVRAGAAFIKGRFYYSDAEQTVALAANGTANPRIDLIVIRLDRTANTISTAAVQGTASVTPSEPALTRNATTHEIPLAAVAVAAGATSIAAGNVTDRRQWSIPNGKGLPTCRLWRATDQTVANNTQTAVQFSQALHDSGQFWVSTANTRCTIQRAGVYEFTANARFAANASGLRQYQIRVNGSSVIAIDSSPGASGTEFMRAIASGPRAMAAGDYVELVAFQTSGGDLALQAASEYSPILTAKLVRPITW